MHSHPPTQLCDASCRYRGLYEGTRASLYDLNDKFREAVGRHGRLRNNVITVLKRTYPTQFLKAERQLGQRMSDVNDEMLVGFLSSFVAAPAVPPVPAGLEQLREVLLAYGFDLPHGADLRSWAEAIRATQAIPSPLQDLEQIQADEDVPTAPHREPDGPEMVNLFDRNEPPTHWESNPEGPGPSQAPAEPTEDLAELFAAFDEAADAAAAPPKTLSQLHAERAADRHSDQERPRPEQVPAPWLTKPEPSGPPDEATAPAPSAAPSSADEQERTSANETRGADASSTPDVQPTAADVPSDDERAQELPPAKTPAGMGAMRPQLFPKETAKTRRRKPKRETKVTAAAPGPRHVDVPQAEGVFSDRKVDASVHDKALAQVVLPQPVFTSDLIEIMGSEEDVASWEQSCRDIDDGPVRFIPPKARHRSRGALVIPYSYLREAATEFTRTWWAGCLEQYRGARLYELGVLLHRVGADVVSFDLGENHAMFRLNQPRGLVGVVVTMDADLDRGSETRTALITAVEELLGNPLTMMAVLTTNANALEPMIEALEAEARERGWTIPCPVVAARSWEYAADRGSNAKLILGS